MASLTSILSLINLATGESSYGGFTNWGEVADENFRILEKAIGDVTSKTLSSLDVTLTTDEARSAVIKLSGTLSANVAVETPDVKGVWLVRNDTTGAFSVTFKTDSGNGVVVRQGSGALLFSDGTDIIEAASIADAISLAATISGASGKTTPVDADTVALIDSAASGVLKKLTWANIKATLKSYFDDLTTTLTNKDISSTTNTYRQGTTSAIGALELATDLEAQTGTDTARAITPANLQSVTATESRKGVVELATTSEAAAGTDTARAVTPAGLAARFVLGTAQAATSGTSIDFTSIPSWVKRITIQFVGVSTSGTSAPIIQIGDSGGVEPTGYLGSSGEQTAGSNVTNHTTGFGITDSHNAATVLHGQVVLSLVAAATFTWVSSSVMARSNSAGLGFGAGSKSLSAALDRVRITTINGTDTFDAGSVNILYE